MQVDQSLSTAYGLKKDCILNELKYFHISWGSPSDIAHDLFEGFHFEILKVVVEHCIHEELFSLNELNDRIQNFPYCGKDKTNKPTQLIGESGTKVTIKQTAAQSLCLVRLLPLLIGHLVPITDRQWALYCQYLNILDYIMAPSLKFGEIHQMKLLIEEFLEDFFHVNNHLNVKPKTHFMLHYASQYKEFGPLIHNSTHQIGRAHV